jgi:hypothetical protein
MKYLVHHEHGLTDTNDHRRGTINTLASTVAGMPHDLVRFHSVMIGTMSLEHPLTGEMNADKSGPMRLAHRSTTCGIIYAS